MDSWNSGAYNTLVIGLETSLEFSDVKRAFTLRSEIISGNWNIVVNNKCFLSDFLSWRFLGFCSDICADKRKWLYKGRKALYMRKLRLTSRFLTLQTRKQIITIHILPSYSNQTMKFGPSFVVWLPLLIEMLGNNCIVIVCVSYCDVIIFEIIFSFLTKPFFHLTKKARTKI